jgi:hypothetical protein
MFNDSNSPQNDYRRLLEWLKQTETQEALDLLKQEADQFKDLMAQLPVKRDLGALLGDFLHREQSFGEIRGLTRLQNIINDRKQELEIKLGLVPKKEPLMPHEY